MASVLGANLLDDQNAPIPVGGEGLLRLAHLDVQGLDPRLRATEVIVACDVRNPLLGTDGASVTFAPQKGATPADVDILESALTRFRHVVMNTMGLDLQQIPGGGAAGGLGAGLAAFCNGILKPGIDIVLDALGFDDLLADADLVLTGEGQLDAQTRQGKVVSGVVRRCSDRGIPVAAVVGSVAGLAADDVPQHGYAGVATLVGPDVSRESAIRNAAELLRVRTGELMRRLQST